MKLLFKAGISIGLAFGLTLLTVQPTAAKEPRGASSKMQANSPHVARSSEAKRAFEKAHPCPSTGKSSGACPGYVVDHVVPLKRGGTDSPSNMQWQTTDEAKAKDRVE